MGRAGLSPAAILGAEEILQISSWETMAGTWGTIWDLHGRGWSTVCSAAILGAEEILQIRVTNK